MPNVSDPPAAEAGRVLSGRYELVEELGRGGMGTVWVATDTRLGREVAIKRLRPDLPPGASERLAREARAAAGILDHRVVTVLDLDHDDDGEPFLVLERHHGATLADELRDGALPADRLELLVDDLLGALGAAHEVGVLHRDVKPANVLTGPDGYRVTDFGLASIEQDPATETDLMGTLVYVAPERLAGDRGTVRSDLFSAAIVIHEAATGTHPFRSANAADSLARLRRGDVDVLPDRFPDPMRDAIRRALDADPEARPGSAAELAVACRAASSPAPATEALPDPTTTAVLPAPAPAATDRDATAVDGAAVGPVAGDTAALPAGGIPGADAPVVPVRRPRPDPMDRLRRTSVEQRFAVGCVALLVVLFLVVLGDRGGEGTPPATDGSEVTTADASPTDPVAPEGLDATLDRIVELGR